MICPVELAHEVSAWQAARVREHGVLRRWICEMHVSREAQERELPDVFAVRVERVSAAPLRPLLCSNKGDLISQLRAVGRHFYDQGVRRHLEWTWTGERLWIVQNDAAPDHCGYSPEPPHSLASPVQAKRLRVFRPNTSKDAKKWQKLDCVEKFRSAGQPTTSLFVLEGAPVLQTIADGHPPRRLLQDLAELTKSPLVVRTDVAGEARFFAPRTDIRCCH